jgi:hypothetical protein
LQVESCEVMEVAVKLIFNGSSPGTWMFVHGSFKMAKDIFAKVEFDEICVEYVYELCYSSTCNYLVG